MQARVKQVHGKQNHRLPGKDGEGSLGVRLKFFPFTCNHYWEIFLRIKVLLLWKTWILKKHGKEVKSPITLQSVDRDFNL